MHYSHITKNTCPYMYYKIKYSLQYGIKQLLNDYYSLVIAKLQYNYRKLSFNQFLED